MRYRPSLRVLRCRVAMVIAAWTVAAACGSRQGVSSVDGHAASPPDGSNAIRAQSILDRHCGACHDGAVSSSPPALAAFDFQNPRWAQTLDQRQAHELMSRLQGGMGPAGPFHVSPSDVAIVAAFVRELFGDRGRP